MNEDSHLEEEFETRTWIGDEDDYRLEPDPAPGFSDDYEDYHDLES